MQKNGVVTYENYLVKYLQFGPESLEVTKARVAIHKEVDYSYQFGS